MAETSDGIFLVAVCLLAGWLAGDLDDIDALRRAVAGRRVMLKRAVERLAGLPD